MSNLVWTLIGLGGSLLLLSLLVLVLQELWNYLSRTRSRLYMQVLEDMFGSWAHDLVDGDLLPNLVARGPFQAWRREPVGDLLPAGAKSLVAAFERTTPHWVRRTIEQLDLEVDLQDGEPDSGSPAWRQFTASLAEFAGPANRRNAELIPGQETAQELVDFLRTWSAVPKTARGTRAVFDAWAVRAALRRDFMGHILEVERDYPQLMRNYAYVTRRHNLRLTFTIALGLALLFSLPFHALIDQAALPGTTELAAAAQSGGLTLAEAREQLTPDGFRYFGGAIDGLGPIGDVARYIFGCMVTAVLVCFGAPFVHDLAARVAGRPARS